MTDLTPFVRVEFDDGFSQQRSSFLVSGSERPAVYDFDISAQPPLLGLAAISGDAFYDGREIAKAAYSDAAAGNLLRGNAAAERFTWRDPLGGQVKTRDLAVFGNQRSDGSGELLVFEIPRQPVDVGAGDPPQEPLRVLEFERGVREASYDEGSGLLALVTYGGTAGILDLKTLLETPGNIDSTFDDRGYEHPALVAPPLSGGYRACDFYNGNLFLETYGGTVRRFPVVPRQVREKGWIWFDLQSWMLNDGRAPQAALELAEDMAFFATDVVDGNGAIFVTELGTYAIDLLEGEEIALTLSTGSGVVLASMERSNAFAAKREHFSLNALRAYFKDLANQKMLRQKGYLPFRLAYAITRNQVVQLEEEVNFPVFYQTPATEDLDVFRFYSDLDLLARRPHLFERDGESVNIDERLNMSFGRLFRADTSFQPGL